MVVDGLLGTGFQGTVEGKLRELIEQVNASKLPVLSIDIPSGVNGNTGEADCAIVAEETLYLGMAKRGFFVGKGYNHVGKLCRVDFGMDPKYCREAQGVGHLMREEALKALLPPLQRDRHKYQAGYVIAIAGSPGMPGAAMLSCFSCFAHRSRNCEAVSSRGNGERGWLLQPMNWCARLTVGERIRPF